MTTIVVEQISTSIASFQADSTPMLPYIQSGPNKQALTEVQETSGSDRASLSNHISSFNPLSSKEDPAKIHREKLRYRAVAGTIFWAFFTLGMNDGSTGPLIPVYQSYYHINFMTVSMIFICNCLGCLTSAVLNVFLSRRVAFSKILMLATIYQIAAYSILAARPIFPVMCVGFFVNGMGMSLINAQGNAILGMLHNPTAMGFAHASYGIGALVAPLISTHFSRLPKWNFHYIIFLGLAAVDLATCLLVFRGKGYEEVLTEMGVSHTEEIQIRPENSRDEEEIQPAASENNTFARVLKMPQVHILAVFVFIYVGVEVSIGGWIVTFIINDRGGGASSGYISTGFFAGLALGRVVLLWVTKALGEQMAIYLYIALCIAFEMVVWFVPSIIGNAIAVSLVGLTLGPLFPIVMTQHARLVPRKILSSSIGWIAGFGQCGSAVIPFMTGALANRYGIVSLQPLIVAMMATMAVLWFILPTVSKRHD